jgi:hypothetical protein
MTPEGLLTGIETSQSLVSFILELQFKMLGAIDQHIRWYCVFDAVRITLACLGAELSTYLAKDYIAYRLFLLTTLENGVSCPSFPMSSVRELWKVGTSFMRRV